MKKYYSRLKITWNIEQTLPKQWLDLETKPNLFQKRQLVSHEIMVNKVYMHTEKSG